MLYPLAVSVFGDKMADVVEHHASGLNLQFVSAEENEFLAKEECINITASASSNGEINLISGKFGPIFAGLPCKVPLWFALQMRKNGKCTIEVPEWLSVDALKQNIAEQKSDGTLVSVPFFYIETAQLLLNNSKEDFPSPEETRSLVEDLFNLRMDLLRDMLASQLNGVKVAHSSFTAKLPNLGAAELLCLRGMFPQLLEAVSKYYDDSSTSGTGTIYGRESGSSAGGSRASANTESMPQRRTLRRLRNEDP